MCRSRRYRVRGTHGTSGTLGRAEPADGGMAPRGCTPKPESKLWSLDRAADRRMFALDVIGFFFVPLIGIGPWIAIMGAMTIVCFAVGIVQQKRRRHDWETGIR